MSAPRSLDDWLRWQEQLHPAEIELGLDRVRVVAQRLELLPYPVPAVTVGGTNGKGTAVAVLDNLLRAGGYATGVYTSPHLIRYNERVRIRGRLASDAELCEAFSRVESAREGVQLTYFEFGTLAALWLFARAALDVVLLEVGLGGRLDAVNIVDAQAALVTGVAEDHAEWLGCDREAIGLEKAGIYRAGAPAVYAGEDPPRSLWTHAEKLGARFYLRGRDFDLLEQGEGWAWTGRRWSLQDLPLPGGRSEPVLDNAAGALAVLECLAAQFPLEARDVVTGLHGELPRGRFDILQLPGRVSLVLDVAHNKQAIAALAAALRRLPSARHTWAVCGMLADKPAASVVPLLGAQVDGWFLGGLPGTPRGLSGSALAGGLGAAEAPIEAFDRVAAAYQAALEAAGPGDRIVVFGSFYTVAAVLQQLEKDNR